MSVHGWCAYSRKEIFLSYVGGSMPIESLNSVIALAFVTVWLMVGQFSFIKN